jgi:hypothetical protein
MADIFNTSDRPNEVESLLRSARNYVAPSDDLRPRVLETARSEQRERRMQQRLAQMAAIILFMVTAVTVFRQPLNENQGGAFLPAVESISARPEYSPARSVDHASWETVESFTDLRQRQAQLLRL